MASVSHRFFLAMAAAMLCAAVPATVGAATGAATVPRYEPSACPVTVTAGERIDCGTLVVPEHRGKAGSRTIQLPVMIFRSSAASPAPDPVVYLPGGPGLSSIAGRTSGKGNPFLAERDQILLEGRGNAFARPSLACPEVNALRAKNADAQAQVDAVKRCRATLVAQGIDLDGYTSAESADDLDDLRRLLGIHQWNLIGYSYGTRLAQTVLARHPEGVRSVVLDSVLPIDVNYDETATAALRRAIHAVSDGCATDPGCDARYPQLRSRFAALIARADRDGIRTPDGRVLRGRDVVDAMASAIQQPAMIPQLPGIVSAAADGRIDKLLPLTRPEVSSFNWGLRLSVWCGEEMPFEKPARVARQVDPAEGLGGADSRTVAPELCAAWHVTPAEASANQPVKSDVPVLILAGQFDPVTPPAWGRRLLRTLPNARFVEIPGQAHGAMFNRCGGRLALAFLHDPAAPLDLQCAATFPGVDFSAE